MLFLCLLFVVFYEETVLFRTSGLKHGEYPGFLWCSRKAGLVKDVNIQGGWEELVYL